MKDLHLVAIEPQDNFAGHHLPVFEISVPLVSSETDLCYRITNKELCTDILNTYCLGETSYKRSTFYPAFRRFEKTFEGKENEVYLEAHLDKPEAWHEGDYDSEAPKLYFVIGYLHKRNDGNYI